MNVVKIIGGLGNQLFQYAFGTVLQKYGKDVKYDMSWTETKDRHNSKFPRLFRLPMFQLQHLNLGKCIQENPTINECKVGYSTILFKMQNENNFEGYWQYYPYYKDIIPQLQAEFQLKTEVYTEEFLKYAEMIWNTESISLHVRRGDYQLHRKGSFHDLKAAYYFDALTRVNHIKGDLFIFSDDIPWCRQTFDQDFFSRKLIFVDIDDYLAFELQRMCKHNIITNSTFSWWAAVLNNNPDKVVVCPHRYLGDNEEDSNNLRLPQEWIKVNDHAIR